MAQSRSESRGYTDVIHTSRLNKRLLSKHCREELISAAPDLEGIKISEDRILTSLIRYYLGGKYGQAKSEVENELQSVGK